MMHVVVVTPSEPDIDLQQAMAQLGLSADDDTLRVTDLIAAAQATIDGPEGWLNRAIGMQTLEARVDEPVCGEIALPYPPLIEVVSVTYLNAAGVRQTVDPSFYTVDVNSVVPAGAWPFTGAAREAVRIRYRAGKSPIDPRARQAILLLAQAEFDGDPDGELKRRANAMLETLWLPR